LWGRSAIKNLERLISTRRRLSMSPAFGCSSNFLKSNPD
jgi:hypothetical protein